MLTFHQFIFQIFNRKLQHYIKIFKSRKKIQNLFAHELNLFKLVKVEYKMLKNKTLSEKTRSTSDLNETEFSEKPIRKSLLQVPMLIRERSRSLTNSYKRQQQATRYNKSVENLSDHIISTTTRNKSVEHIKKIQPENEIKEEVQIYDNSFKEDSRIESNSYLAASANSFIKFFRNGMNASKKRMSYNKKSENYRSHKNMAQNLQNSKIDSEIQKNNDLTGENYLNIGLRNKSTESAETGANLSSLEYGTDELGIRNLLILPYRSTSISRSISKESVFSDSFEENINKIYLNSVNTNIRVSILGYV